MNQLGVATFTPCPMPLLMPASTSLLQRPQPSPRRQTPPSGVSEDLLHPRFASFPSRTRSCIIKTYTEEHLLIVPDTAPHLRHAPVAQNVKTSLLTTNTVQSKKLQGHLLRAHPQDNAADD